MSKFYNEIIIDMNPESSTFEETLYEDSFEYEGDIILMQGSTMPKDNDVPEDPILTQTVTYKHVYDDDTFFDQLHYVTLADGTVSTYKWSKSKGYFVNMEDDVGVIPTSAEYSYATMDDFNENRDDAVKYAEANWSGSKAIDMGLTGDPEMTNERWTAMTQDEKARYMLTLKYGDPDSDGYWYVPQEGGGTTALTIEDMKKDLKFEPILGEIADQDISFLIEKYGGAYDPETGEWTPPDYGPGPDGIYGSPDDPDTGLMGKQAALTYGKAGRARDTAGIAYDAAGLLYDKAGLTYETAGVGFEGAKTSAGLQKKTAARTKETMLASLQEQALGIGTPSSGTDIRKEKFARENISKKFETGVDIYEDEMTRIQSDYGAAQDIYDIAGKAYGIAGEAYELDKRTLDVSEEAFVSAGEAYKNLQDQYGYNVRADIYGFEQDLVEDWEEDWYKMYQRIDYG